MRIVIAPPSGPSESILEQLRQWSASSLLDPFCWWVAKDGAEPRADLQVRVVENGGIEEMLLPVALRGHDPARVGMFAVFAAGERDELDPSHLPGVDRCLLAATDVIPFDPVNPNECILVMIPGRVGQQIPKELIKARWGANLYVAPEDLPKPGDFNQLPGQASRFYTPHAAHAVASIAELWSGGEEDDVIKALKKPIQGDIAAAVRVARTFSRAIDLGYLPDHVAASVFQAGDNWPNPDPDHFDRVSNTGKIVPDLARRYLEEYEEVLGCSSFEPIDIPEEEPMGIIEALKYLWRLIVDFVRRKPGEMVEDAAYKAINAVAGKVESIGKRLDTDFRVARYSRQAKQDGVVVFEEVFEAPLLFPDGPVGPAWTDLCGLSIGLVDGSSLPHFLDPSIITRNNRRALITAPQAIVPDASKVPGLIDDEFETRACDPLGVDPRLARLRKQILDERSAPMDDFDLEGLDEEEGEGEAPQESVPLAAHDSKDAREEEGGGSAEKKDEDDGEEDSAEPSYPDDEAEEDEKAEAEGDREDEVTAEAEDEPETVASDSPQTSPESAADPKREEPADPNVQIRKEWTARHRAALVWQVGEYIAKQLSKAYREAEPPPELTEEEKEAEEKRREEEKLAFVAGNKRLRRLALFAVTAAAFFLVLIVWGMGISSIVKAIASVLIGAGWILLLALVARSSRRRQAKFDRKQIMEEIEVLNRKMLESQRAGDKIRLTRRYEEYKDWAESLGWFLHHPWIGDSDERIRQVGAIDPDALPASFVLANGRTDKDKLEQLGARARRDLLSIGWLNGHFERVSTAALRDSLLLSDSDPADAALPNPMSDTSDDDESPRRSLLTAIRRGDHRRLRENEMTADLLRLIEDVSIDALSSGVSTDSSVAPLAPSSFWREGHQSLRDLVNDVETTVVTITVAGAGGMRRGTGVLVSADGRIATVSHLLGGAEVAKVSLSSGDEFEARVVGVSTTTDLAILKIEGIAAADVPEPASTPPPNQAVSPSETVFTVGHAEEAPDRVTASWGQIGRTKQRVRIRNAPKGVGVIDVLEVRCKSLPGSSGSPVFDMEQNLIGVISGQSNPEEDEEVPVTHVIAVAEVHPLLRSTDSLETAPSAGEQTKATMLRPSKFLNDLCSVLSGTPMLRQHWRNPGDEQFVKVVVPEPHTLDGADAKLGRIATAKFLEPLRVLIHRVELTRPVDAEALASIEAVPDTETPRPAPDIDLPSF